MSSEIWVPYRFNTWNLRTSVCLLVIWTWIGVGRWHPWFTLTLWPFRGQPRSSEVNDLCAPRGNLVRWFWIWHPFAIHMCRNRVIGAIKYPEEKCQFFYFDPQKRTVGGRNASHSSPTTVRNVLVSALACSDTKLSANSHFGHFWVIDLTSEVISWPRTLNSGVNGFVSWQATRWFFNRSSNSLRSQTRGWSYPPPPPREGWRNSECHFLQIKVCN